MRPILSWMEVWLRPIRQKMPPKMMAEETLLIARATFVALSRLICRLQPCTNACTPASMLSKSRQVC